MGSLIGGVIGGIGSLIGGHHKAQADREASRQALTGYNYLTSGDGAPATDQYIRNGTAANNSQAQLLGQAPITAGTANGFNNYLNSTAYKFQLGQGQDAVNSDYAAKGLLDSGATAKALTKYGQNLAGTTFNNYLGQLNTLSNTGQRSLGQVAGAGSAGGASASQATQAAGSAQANGLNGALGNFSNVLGSIGGGRSYFPPAPSGGAGLY